METKRDSVSTSPLCCENNSSNTPQPQPFTLRLRTPKETKIITELSPNSTFFQLQTLIHQQTGIPFAKQKSALNTFYDILKSI
jgi:hypothetical protein